ncbi:hypothetical protein FNV43_RR22589 [Rhamnella rubrinervis]|uniref:Uncharacterized protein n=1 Tax=Rhamnella rubrinervis TaxID=2594499 RepID=A0A8K0DQR3_9ROSA|nr:hypothetical protein FNV43_RR22589 [Rhamnella rubrinervis]
MDVWSWICELPNSSGWTESSDDSLHVFELASSGPAQDDSTRSIQLRAQRTTGSHTTDVLVTFSVCLQGFQHLGAKKILWVSDTCSLSSDKPFLPLVLQLLQEIIFRSPTAQGSTCPRSQLQKLKPDPVSWIMDSHSPESLSSFFSLVFITRLFWLCACDSPSEVGSLFFRSLLAPNIEALSCKNAPVLRTFLITVGIDTELCFMRTIGYMLAKWCILREVGVGLQTLTPLASENLGFSYGTESHGLWILKGYAPVPAMKLTRSNLEKSQFPIMEARDSVLKYALAHQQLEVVIQLEYSVGFYAGYIQVDARVDNLRLHVVKLGYNRNDDVDYGEEKHFPSRIRVWVGPEVGASYVSGLSLGRSTDNGEKEVVTHKIVKGNFEKRKMPKVKAVARTSTKTRKRNWKWDQDAEGNAAVFDAVLCDNTTGQEVATCKEGLGGGENNGFRKRYSGSNRAFTKSGGLVMAGDEYVDGCGWRLSKEMEGSVLKWRMGGQIWLSYCANEVQSSYCETRCVEWCDEVDLPLFPPKHSF